MFADELDELAAETPLRPVPWETIPGACMECGAVDCRCPGRPREQKEIR